MLGQGIHLKNQALFSSKDKSKTLKCHLLQFLFGALRVKLSLKFASLFQCQRLEEKGHESLLITFSDDGHLVLGSENGKRFLEARNGLIDDFIHFCAGKINH